jgi:hypothetical protein
MIRLGVFRMLRDGTLLSDSSRDAFTVAIGCAWVARFGEDWRAKYPTTWAAGLGSRVWYYTPKERSHVA